MNPLTEAQATDHEHQWCYDTAVRDEACIICGQPTVCRGQHVFEYHPQDSRVMFCLACGVLRMAKSVQSKGEQR